MACAFLDNRLDIHQSLSYGELDRQARAHAARLLELCEPGDRVLLLYPQSLEFLVGFLACLYAGVIAVPLYPPRPNRNLARMLAVLEDADARLALTTTDTAQIIHEAEVRFGVHLPCELLVHDQLTSAARPEHTRTVSIGPEDLAFLQYTSGSTGTPKGVMVSHGNLAANISFIATRCGLGPDDVMVTWLPTFHDMGLIFGLLQPLYRGAACYQMTPASFVQKPVRWLQALSRYGGTHSASPNFGFELCVRKVTEEEIDALDLSRWRTAMNGAEPIRADTIQRFGERFARCGLQPTAHTPAYGMAEYTLVASMSAADASAQWLEVEAAALEAHRVTIASAPSGSRHVVACGTSDPAAEIAIVAPDTLVRCPPGSVGEIWLRGPSNAKGYWRRPVVTAETFFAYTDDHEGPYLRTGDLGFVHEGQLYVTGRRKDLIIIRGQNHYPQDIEHTVAGDHPALRPGCTAAFTVESNGEQRLVVVQEVRAERLETLTNADRALFEDIRAQVADEHELHLSALVLLPPYHIPKTSSGKIQRALCKQRFMSDDFVHVVAAWSDLAPSGEATPAHESARPHALLPELRALVAAELGCAPDALAIDAPLARYGMDSATAVATSGAVAERFGLDVPTTLLYDHPTLARLADHLAQRLQCGDPGASELHAPRGERPAAVAAEPIAVIGVACRLPGADDPDALWRLSRAGTDVIRDRPAATRATCFGHPDQHRPGGYLARVDEFDPGYFGISPREARYMDPQQRLLLELAAEAMADAGVAPRTLIGSNTGVFVGISGRDYERLMITAGVAPHAYAATGNALSIAANRLSHAFGLTGPSVAIDTACSSSLVAVHYALASLRRGECELALAGGVNLLLDHRLSTGLDQAGMLSPDSRCKSFDAAANGYVRSEGGALVLLRRQRQASRDDDPIRGLILDTAVNQDGRSNGLTAPVGPAQEAVIASALADAGVAPAEIGYVEAHGSGTALGDPIEWHALERALGSPAGGARYVGSIKANLGHLEAAAGIAGLLRALLIAERGEIHPLCHYRRMNSNIRPTGALTVAHAVTPWAATSGSDGGTERRIAGVSSFGFGGTNAHAVVSSAPERALRPERASALPCLLSASSEAGLRALVGRVHELLSEPARAPRWADLCCTLAAGRDHARHRLAVVASSPPEAARALAAWLRGDRHPGLFTATAPAHDECPVAFLFPGQGSPLADTIGQLSRSLPRVRALVDAADALVGRHLDLCRRRTQPSAPSSTEAAQDTRVAQVSVVTQGYVLARLLSSWGVRPSAVLGHSVGELAAAAAAEVMSFEECLTLTSERARLMHALPPGGMLAIMTSEEHALALAEGLAVDLAAVNGPAQVAVSGPPEALATLEERLRAAEVSYRRLPVAHAFHSAMVDPILDQLEAVAGRGHYRAGRLLWYANVTGAPHANAPDPRYFRRHARSPVRFYDALLDLRGRGIHACVQVGSGRALLSLAREVLDGPLLATSGPKQDVWRSLSTTLARLHLAGVGVDWAAFFNDAGGQRVSGLPGPTFERRPYWFATPPAASAEASGHTSVETGVRTTAPSHP